MPLEYAYGGNGRIEDFELATASDFKAGQLVKFDANGKVVAAVIADTDVLGVVEGLNFKGITEGGKYAVPTVTNNSQRLNLVKVRTDGDTVYRVELKSGATAPKVGTKYALTAVDHTATLDTAAATNTNFLVVDYDADKKVAFVKVPATLV